MKDDLEKSGIVVDIQKYSMHDGPGIRTLVFLKGCPLHCRWCSNPESISGAFQVMFLSERCSSCGRCAEVCPSGVHQVRQLPDGLSRHDVNRNKPCSGCGRCLEACPSSAIRIAGRSMTAREVIDVILEDSAFYFTSGGGLTIGGGEPTMQAEFAEAILSEAKKNGVHTAMETCGYADWETFRTLSMHTDLFLFDLKNGDSCRHREQTGVGNEKIVHNLTMLLENGAQVTARMPLIVGMNDQRAVLQQTMRFLEKLHKEHGTFTGLEVLPYHRLGGTKYKQLGIPNIMAGTETYTEHELAEIEGYLKTFELPSRLVRH